jgi:hypothetical protein
MMDPQDYWKAYPEVDGKQFQQGHPEVVSLSDFAVESIVGSY